MGLGAVVRQRELFGEFREFMNIEAKDGVFQTDGVDCSCGDEGCRHREVVAEVREGSRNWKSIFKSAFHKELRRGDPDRAIPFGRLCDRFRSGDAVAYMRKIVFEETRNLDLFVKLLRKELSMEEMVLRFCSAKRDWVFSWDVGCMSPEFVMFEWRPVPLDVPGFFVRAIDELDVEEAYAVMQSIIWAGDGRNGFWPPERHREFYQEMLDVLQEAAKKRHPEKREAIMGLRSWQPNDEAVVLFELAFGLWQEDADEYVEMEMPGQDEMFDIPRLRDYVFDWHGWMGKSRIRKAMGAGKIGWGKPMPSGIDLRWSGEFAGTLWRYLAQQQHGTVDVPWEAVRVPDEMRGKYKEKFGPVK